MQQLKVTIRSIALLLIALASPILPAQAGQAAGLKGRFSHPLNINNPYSPLVAGTIFVYDGTVDGKRSHERFIVTRQTKTVRGVTTRVVDDRDYENGVLVEQTFDWFAQDDAGNVWYFGEFATQYENGKVVGHEGSWRAGTNGASEGIIMEAHPKVGDTYPQEVAPGVGADKATVVSLNKSLCVPYGCFSRVLETKEFSPLEPGVIENKYYALGVGQIKAVMVKGGSEASTLTTVRK